MQNIHTKKLFDFEYLEDVKFEDIQALLDQGADINARDSRGYTILENACDHPLYELVSFLLDNGANPNQKTSDTGSLLQKECGSGDIKLVEMLIKRGANINYKDDRGDTPMSYAVEYDNLHIVELLVLASVKVDKKHIDTALANFSMEMLDFLLKEYDSQLYTYRDCVAKLMYAYG
jgi:ankyrin repeat protein